MVPHRLRRRRIGLVKGFGFWNKFEKRRVSVCRSTAGLAKDCGCAGVTAETASGLVGLLLVLL